MALQDLMAALEESAQERIREIHERAGKETQEIRKEAEEKAAGSRGRCLQEAGERALLENARRLSRVRMEARALHLRTKNELLEKAFTMAGERISSVRARPGYRGIFERLLSEALEAFPEGEVVLSVDPRDEALCRDVVRERGTACRVQADRQTAGGMVVSSASGAFVVDNTLEARLDAARGHLRPAVIRALLGG